MRPAGRLAATVAVAALLGSGCSDEPDAPPVAPATTERTSTTTTTGAAPTPTIATTAPSGPIAVTLRQVAQIAAPTAMVPRDGTDDLYAAERRGTVRRLRVDGDALAVEPTPVLDIRDDVADLTGERGLLGLAFAPGGDHLFVSYTDGDDDGASVIARYAMDGDVADPASRLEILRIDQPYPNHNGGDIAFGPDGNLWAGYGDGGSQGDPDDNAQDRSRLLGKMLRIDVSRSTADEPYAVPADNPFPNTMSSARAEIWAWGLRNPWRFSFDRANGDLWIADVGGSRWEEINHLPAASGRGRGANLGWNVREGAHDTGEARDPEADYVDPVFEYDHSEGASITGGFVYRGTSVPALTGVYLFSDFAAAELRGVVATAGGADEVALEIDGEELSQVASFAEDATGEMYVLQLTGEVVRIAPG